MQLVHTSLPALYRGAMMTRAHPVLVRPGTQQGPEFIDKVCGRAGGWVDAMGCCCYSG